MVLGAGGIGLLQPTRVRHLLHVIPSLSRLSTLSLSETLTQVHTSFKATFVTQTEQSPGGKAHLHHAS